MSSIDRSPTACLSHLCVLHTFSPRCFATFHARNQHPGNVPFSCMLGGSRGQQTSDLVSSFVVIVYQVFSNSPLLCSSPSFSLCELLLQALVDDPGVFEDLGFTADSGSSLNDPCLTFDFVVDSTAEIMGTQVCHCLAKIEYRYIFGDSFWHQHVPYIYDQIKDIWYQYILAGFFVSSQGLLCLRSR